jgi:hypothetical protein
MKGDVRIDASDVDPLGCAEMAGRIGLAVVFVIFALNVSACRSPIIEINRTGPLLPDVKLIEFNDSLNGNTVTPGAIAP